MLARVDRKHAAVAGFYNNNNYGAHSSLITRCTLSGGGLGMRPVISYSEVWPTIRI